ncbi:MAG: GAF domain-containing protein [Planctomycetota bacterium]
MNVIRKSHIQVSQSITRRVLESGEPVLTGDARKDERFLSSASISNLKLESVLCVPLRIRGKVHGAIYIDNRFEKNSFHPGTLRFVSFLADQASIFIENARLFEELRNRQASHQAARQQVEELNRELQELLLAREVEPEQARELIEKGCTP